MVREAAAAAVQSGRALVGGSGREERGREEAGQEEGQGKDVASPTDALTSMYQLKIINFNFKTLLTAESGTCRFAPADCFQVSSF